MVARDASGVVAGGLGWRAVELRLGVDGLLTIVIDSGESMEAQLRPEEGSFVVSVTSPAGGLSDFVVSHLDPSKFGPVSSVDRGYVSYFASLPPATEGIEFISNIDIVYLDKAGWRRLVEGTAVPLVVGDPAHCAALRRLGVDWAIGFTEDVHVSFLNRSRGVLGRIEDFASRDVPIMNNVESKFGLRGGGGREMGPPALICGLRGSALRDPDVLAGYLDLIQNGPRGAEVADRAGDVLAYFDVLLNSTGAEKFLLGLGEAMPRDKKEFLLKVLAHR